MKIQSEDTLFKNLLETKYESEKSANLAKELADMLAGQHLVYPIDLFVVPDKKQESVFWLIGRATPAGLDPKLKGI